MQIPAQNGKRGLELCVRQDEKSGIYWCDSSSPKGHLEYIFDYPERTFKILPT